MCLHHRLGGQEHAREASEREDRSHPVVPLMAADHPRLLEVDRDLWRRSAALWRLEPLVALERSKDHRDGDWTPFDLITLQAAALERIMVEMGLMTGARLDDVHRHLCDLAEAAASASHTSPTPTQVADVVLATLRNVDGQGREYRRAYVDYRPVDDQPTVRRDVTFSFVRTSEADDGTFILRATSQAINLMLGALEHDLEHEQQALLLILERQLQDGQFSRALSTAVTSRERTKQYVEEVRSKLDDVRHDVTATSWFGNIDELLDRCEVHLSDQVKQNQQVRRQVEELLDRVDDPEVIVQLQRLHDVITDTYDRNFELRRWLGRTGPEFRRQQDRQVYVLGRTTTLIPLSDGVFRPLMTETVAAAAPIVTAFTTTVAGPDRQRIFDLSCLVARLLAPAHEDPSEVAPPVEHDLDRVDADPVRFDTDTLKKAEKILGAVADQPTRLSTLLARAPDREVAVVLWTDAIARFAPEGDFNDGGTTVIAVDDGARFDDGDFGGADLLLMRIPTPDRYVHGNDSNEDL